MVFKLVEKMSYFNEGFIESCNEESDEEYFLEVDVQYPKTLHELHNDLPFLPGKMKIEKVEKFVANLHEKNEYVIYLRNSKQALNRELVFKKVHGVFNFNQKAWLRHTSKM